MEKTDMIAGIDLSGPSNHKDTALALLDNGEIELISNLSDSEILEIIRDRGVTALGIDAPLSYSETGGNRPSDTELRRLLNGGGYKGIGVMAPTFNRMIYLTARGIRLSRLLQNHSSVSPIFEVHPGAFFALDRYNYSDILSVKKSPAAVHALQGEIESRGFTFKTACETDHEIMAVGVALAVTRALGNGEHWRAPAEYVDSFPFIA
jgi:predicted nuclease with RNAse H fold